MQRSTRLLVCLSMLGTAACVPDAVTGPEPAAPAPEAAVQTAPDAGVADEPAPATKTGPRTILPRAPKSLRQDRDARTLYIIDGVPVEPGAVRGLDPDDIESMEVLTVTAQKPIYANRVWDTVILISLRSGRQRPATY